MQLNHGVGKFYVIYLSNIKFYVANRFYSKFASI